MRITSLILALLPTLATAEYIDYGRQPLGSVTRNGYGYGTARDGTGRPFHFAPGALGDEGAPRRSHGAYIDWTEQPQGQIRRSTPGTYRDATGRLFHLESGALGAARPSIRSHGAYLADDDETQPARVRLDPFRYEGLDETDDSSYQMDEADMPPEDYERLE